MHRSARRARCGTGRIPSIRRRARRRRDVVEEAVVLVEVDEQHRLAPHFGVRGQRVQHPRGVVRALRRARRPGVFGASGDDPRDLRQAAGGHVGLEGLEELVVACLVDKPLIQQVDASSSRRQRARRVIGTAPSPRSLAEGPEAGQRVVAEVVRHVLVDLPADARVLQALRIGGPRVAGGRASSRL